MSGGVEVSVVMPTRDQATRLALTLESFARHAPSTLDWELIVVDDGSVDGTQEVARAYAGRLPLLTVPQPPSGRAAARNTGARMAHGTTLIFCDSDRICSPKLLGAHAAAQGDGSTIHVGEIREVYLSRLEDAQSEIVRDIAHGCAWLADRSRRPHFVAEVYRHVLDPSGTASSPAPWMCFFSGNLSLPRAMFERAGGFDERFVEWGMEHFELGYRLVHAGARIRYLPDAVSFHLAHRRPAEFYERGIMASGRLIRQLHNSFPTDEFVELSLGRSTVADFLAALSQESESVR
ncbi:glycosyltransferase [Streptomyces sp. DSM 41524]|uniref:Glycosyltransferase n=1 Tax=Streptomyces asiaticus subsp. ignotus TaxID=3098222 RepID=A0ABU7Q429_9ACTN|nr:glycosyltransferase [Streptomyces sp. DSM 41524]